MEGEISDKIITLNVGGILHTTTLSTLTSKESMLKSMFRGDYTPTNLLDKDGNPFIDRNGKIFTIILEYLRTGKIFGIHSKDVTIEFEYFGFDVSLSKKKSMSEKNFDLFVKNWKESPAYGYFIDEFVKNFYVNPIESCPNLDKELYNKDIPHEMRYKFNIPDRYMEYMTENFKMGINKKQLLRWLKDIYNFEWCDIIYKQTLRTEKSHLIIDVKYKKEE